MKKRLTCISAILTIFVISSMFLALPAHADYIKVIKFAENIKISDIDEDFYIDMGSRVGENDKVTVKSSNKSVVKPLNWTTLQVVKPGKAKVSITVKKKNGKKTNYKCTVRVYKYKNPIKTLKLGSKNIAKKYKKDNFAEAKSSTSKLTVKPAKGWKIKTIKYRAYKENEDGSFAKEVKRTIKPKSGATIKRRIGKNWYEEIALVMYNKEKHLKEELFLYLSLPKKTTQKESDNPESKSESEAEQSEKQSTVEAIDEIEPNDNKSMANKIMVGATVYGVSDKFDYIDGGSGEDWFKFVAPISGTAKIMVHADEVWRESEKAAADIYDSESNKLTEVMDSMTTDSSTSSTFGVSAGKTYYVRLSGDHYGFFAKNVAYHFQIGYLIGSTTITSKASTRSSITIHWDGKAKATFYQVQYTDKDLFADYSWTKATKVNVTGSSKKISNLNRDTNYYVRVRVAREIAGVTYYSKWSKRVLIKT